ncbi:MAG: HAD hydrolase-like protein [Spirochaetia bacterium]|nr:HAD hydrolase-like protein [Spirochaetia bacterium]
MQAFFSNLKIYGRMMQFDSVKAILFDVDGTLFSSEGMIEGIYKQEFLKHREIHGKPAEIPEQQAIMEQIGKPVVKIFEALAPDLSSGEREFLSESILTELVNSILQGGGHHYEGVYSTIKKLSENYRIFAASNGRLPYVKAILKANSTDSFFEAVPYVDNQNIKNKTELVSSILTAYNLEPQQAALIGDRTSDRDAALDNGCFFIACRFGHGSEEEWEGAHEFIDSINDLLRIF